MSTFTFIKMTKLKSHTRIEFYTKWIINTNNEFSFFSLTIDFLKILIVLVFLILTLSLFCLFILYGKNVPLKDFVLVGSGLIIHGDDDHSK